MKKIALAGLTAMILTAGCSMAAEGPEEDGYIPPEKWPTSEEYVTPSPSPEETPTSDVIYANCAAARDAGAAPLHVGDPGYSTKLDRDGDGVACER